MHKTGYAPDLTAVRQASGRREGDLIGPVLGLWGSPGSAQIAAVCDDALFLMGLVSGGKGCPLKVVLSWPEAPTYQLLPPPQLPRVPPRGAVRDVP